MTESYYPKSFKKTAPRKMMKDDDEDYMEPTEGSMYSVSFFGDSMDPHPIVIRVEANDESTALEMAVAKLEKEYDGACLANPYDEDNEDGDTPDDYKMEVDGTMYGASQPWYVNPQLIHIKEI